ncbi:hypothetical protein [Shewanella sp.]|uniref:hypothetical protein n=1 Tax=Shewanella sp. TaxID=50422 RepID=UPI003A97956F
MRQLPIFALLLGLMAPMAQPSNTAEDWLNQGENDQTQHNTQQLKRKIMSIQDNQQTTSTDLHFNNTDYQFRWEENGQYEFTPVNQPDLEQWQDMITINVLPQVTDGETLAVVANNILQHYQENGMLINTASVPRTETSPAEYLVVAVLGTEAFLEMAMARIRLDGDIGTAIVVSHRIYGQNVGDDMSAWLQQHGPALEQELMSWQDIPRAAVLSSLTNN